MAASTLHKLRPLAALRPYVRPHAATAAYALTALLLAAVLMLSMPAAVGVVIDRGLLAESAASVDRHFIILFGLAVLAAIFGAVRYYLVTWLGERVVADLRNDVYRHVLTLSPRFFDTHRTGEVLSRLNTDTTLVQSMAGVNLSIALRSAMMMAGGLVMLAVTSPVLTAYIAGLIPAVLIPLFIYGRHVRRLSKRTQDRVADTGGIAGETISAIQTVQAYGLEAVHTQRFAQAIVHAFEAAAARIRARAYLTAGAIIIAFGAVVVVLWLGARDVVAGHMSPGELGQFLLYAVMVAGAVASLSEMWGEMQRAAGAMERVIGLLHATPDTQTPRVPAPPPPVRGAFALHGVTFAYPARSAVNALERFSLTVEPGETVALVGASGAGKSTVIQLLLRFYDPASGVITVDGADLRTLKPASFRQRMALVPQDTVLFAESVLANIRYGRPEATDADVYAAAQAAGAMAFIEALPDGFATALGERGTRLSGGQCQRIAIARAILRDPAILLLDEATSALDAPTEFAVRRALDALMLGRTTLIITHRLETVRRADRIVVMDAGRAVESGTHDSLMARGAVYAGLAATRFRHTERTVSLAAR